MSKIKKSKKNKRGIKKIDKEEEKRKMNRREEGRGANWLSQSLWGGCAELPDQK